MAGLCARDAMISTRLRSCQHVAGQWRARRATGSTTMGTPSGRLEGAQSAAIGASAVQGRIPVGCRAIAAGIWAGVHLSWWDVWEARTAARRGRAGPMTTPDWLAQLEACAGLPAPRRGLALEQIVADIFRAQHFTVLRSPGAARPRQTDVLAVRPPDRYLIECKWRSRPADIADLDNLRSRLRRTTGDVCGLLISMSGFSASLQADVLVRREQPVLLLSGDELLAAVGRDHQLLHLLWRKREALLHEGELLLDGNGAARRRRVKVVHPDPEQRFILPDGTTHQVIRGGSGFGSLVYSAALVKGDAVGVTLDIAPPVRNQFDLSQLVDTLTELGWTSGQARWRINQAHASWHGVGAAAFGAELAQWRERTDSRDAHESEEVLYVDVCDGGGYTLSASLLADRLRIARQARLSFQLAGMPLDAAPLLQLVRSLGVHDQLYFRPRESNVTQRRTRLQLSLGGSDDVVARVVSDAKLAGAEPMVSGVVVANPFWADDESARPCLSAPAGLELLSRSQYLICGLRQWHGLARRPRKYQLDWFDAAWTSDVFVCSPVADWQD